MKFPDLPRSGFPIVQTVKDIINYLRSSRIISINGIKGTSTTNGTTFQIPVGEKNRFQKEFLHPFKLITKKESSELRCYVNYGQILESYLRTWNTFSDNSDSQSLQNTIVINSGALLNDPSGGTAGFMTLSASTDYGIWLKGKYKTTGTFSDYFSTGESDSRGYKKTDGFTLRFVNIEAESSYTDPSSKPDNGEVWLFLGKIEVDSDLNATITQHWKSDIILPSYAQPWVEPSVVSGNSIYLETDGLIYVKSFVSADADNSITTGTDGGVYYDAPPVVSSDADNSITEGSDGGAYYDAP